MVAALFDGNDSNGSDGGSSDSRWQWQVVVDDSGGVVMLVVAALEGCGVCDSYKGWK